MPGIDADKLTEFLCPRQKDQFDENGEAAAQLARQLAGGNSVARFGEMRFD